MHLARIVGPGGTEHERGRDDAPAPANVGRLDADSGGVHRDLVIALQIPPGVRLPEGQLEPSRTVTVTSVPAMDCRGLEGDLSPE